MISAGLFSFIFLMLLRSIHTLSLRDKRIISSFRQTWRVFGGRHSSSGSTEVEDELWKKWSYGTFPLNEQTNATTISTENESHDGVWYDPLDPLWLKSISDDTVQHALRVLSAFITPTRKERFQAILQQRSDRVRFVFENPNNPNNVWATLRTFDSFALQFIDIIFNPTEYYTTSFRRNEMNNALGSQKWMTIFQHHSTADCLRSLKEEGYLILATDLHQSSVSLPDVDLTELARSLSTHDLTKSFITESPKIAIVLGNEHSGITEEVRKLSDQLIYLPMKGFAQSFNLSVAAAIVCAILQSKGMIQPNLPPELKDRILFIWYMRSIKQSVKILRKNNINIRGNAV